MTGTLDVRVRGNTLAPTTIFGRFAILCAILRQLHLILHICLLTSELRELSPDAFFVDQLSAGLPLLKYLSRRAPIFFYCHFPDLLLAQGRAALWKRLYRVPFDALEQWSMGYADAIAVNSAFTKYIVSRTWPRLAARKPLHVVHPCINTSPSPEENQLETPLPWKSTRILLSINRFERKKNIALALQSYALLPASTRKNTLLILAGGHDPRVAENVAYHTELVQLAEQTLHLRTATASTLPSALSINPREVQVLFLLSVPNLLKDLLLRSATLLLYTPENEHFGIVPLEAMLRGTPVLAADSGGPRETVVEGVTGWLRSPEKPEAWRRVIEKVLELEGSETGKAELREMGRRGRERVRGMFAEEQMAERLEKVLDGMKIEEPGVGLKVLVGGSVVLAGLVGVLAAVMGWYMFGGRGLVSH